MKKPLLFLFLLFFFNAAFAQYTTVDGTGNSPIYHQNSLVGVGTTNFGEKLNVGGNIQVEFNHSIGVAQTGDKFIFEGFNVGHYSLGYYTNYSGPPKSFYSAYGGINLFTGGANRFSILTNGNIGIGTNNPHDILHINGNLSIQPTTDPTSPAYINFKRTSDGWLPARIGQLYNLTNWGAHLIFETNAGGGHQQVLERMRIMDNGNVGIGTTNPGSFKLAVEGTIGARQVKVLTTTPWPDYIFEPTYQLPSLTKVESYIKDNKHLPDVPSAKEVEKEGIDLGKMDATLLKKIEELTLYMIVMQKENNNLKERVIQLEKVKK